MSKILIIPSNKEQFRLNCDGLIIGIKGLCTNMANFELDDLKGIDKEIFVSLNKNMFNKDLDYLKETLIKLNNYNIKGVIFYDIAVLNLYKKLNLNYDLVWNQEHMTTNYDTINFYYDQGVKYTYVSSDITLREMIEIKNNTKSILMANIFGYVPIFNSKRKLITNYFKTFNLKGEPKFICNEGKKYPIVEEDGTIVYSDFILNGFEESKLLNYDYVVLNSFRIDNFEDVLNNFEYKDNQKGFFYEDVVYKVK